jgi:hypothetical protein
MAKPLPAHAIKKNVWARVSPTHPNEKHT